MQTKIVRTLGAVNVSIKRKKEIFLRLSAHRDEIVARTAVVKCSVKIIVLPCDFEFLCTSRIHFDLRRFCYNCEWVTS